jgi:hypothetical protein
MRPSTFLLAIIAVALLSFTSPVNDQKGNAGPWKFIADKRVGWGVDHDVIHTGNVRDDFRQIKIRVTDGPLRMYDMKIYFDNGEIQDVAIRNVIRQGGESRVIDLDGGLRHLSRIEFWYETKGYARGKARVAVWGRK